MSIAFWAMSLSVVVTSVSTTRSLGVLSPLTDCVLWRMTFSNVCPMILAEAQTVKNRPAAIITAIQIESLTEMPPRRVGRC